MGSLPAFLLFGWFLATLLVALRRHRIAVGLLLVGLMASVAIFVYDAKIHNWQLHVEPYQHQTRQKTFHYATWWWYDQSWFN